MPAKTKKSASKSKPSKPESEDTEIPPLVFNPSIHTVWIDRVQLMIGKDNRLAMISLQAVNPIQNVRQEVCRVHTSIDHLKKIRDMITLAIDEQSRAG